MPEISIYKTNNWCYEFYADGEYSNDIYINTPLCCCVHCKGLVSKVYSYIINNLIEAKLLPENYELICCYCQVMKRFGLLELIKHIYQLSFSAVTGILTISFRIPGCGCIIHFYIHDYLDYEEI